ncbi:MAG TPA: hypothetical protein QGH10_04755, partial [Armatimonadota bacterium]|nr:hypothetical protein [Armatimonadota bacterium]
VVAARRQRATAVPTASRLKPLLQGWGVDGHHRTIGGGDDGRHADEGVRGPTAGQPMLVFMLEEPHSVALREVAGG